jgi:hypothetical protein
MRNVRRMACALALAGALLASGTASAAPRDDDPRDLRGMLKRAVSRIVTILEDIRMGIPS